MAVSLNFFFFFFKDFNIRLQKWSLCICVVDLADYQYVVISIALGPKTGIGLVLTSKTFKLLKFPIDQPQSHHLFSKKKKKPG